MTVTVPHYVTTDGSGRWTGTGAPLSAAYFDEDLYTLQAAINGLALAEGVGVASISQPTAGTLLFTMSDASTWGPFPLPVGEWDFQGDWTASTVYAVNDVVQHNSTLYAVIFAHTSGTTFDPAANDGSGHNYYRVMVTFPSGVLPTGGTTGQALVKASGTDFDTVWSTVTGLPTGGASGKFVAWLSSGVGQWLTPLQLPTGGTAGQIPIKNSSTDGDASWADLPGPSLTGNDLSATTGAVDYDGVSDVMTVVPTGNITLNAPSPTNKTISLIVTTSGTTSYTITFGTNFKSEGTLATGTVSGKAFIVKFDGNSGTFYEFARSAAL
jgi:hypothetical protein